MSQPARIEWYWGSAYDLGRERGGFVHNGPCRFAALLMGWPIYPCVANPLEMERKYPGQGYYWPPRQVDKGDDGVCLVCKRWEPPSEYD